MTAAQGGCERAFQKLISKHNSLLRTVVMRVVGKDADADDVLSEAFINLWNKLARYDPAQGAPLGWMVTFCRRRAIDFCRRRQSYHGAVERATEVALHDFRVAESTDSAFEKNELLDLTDAAMEEIPPEQARVFRGHLGGLSQREMAAQWGIPLGTIKTRFELAVQKLRGKLHQLKPMENHIDQSTHHRLAKGEGPHKLVELLEAKPGIQRTTEDLAQLLGNSRAACYQMLMKLRDEGKIKGHRGWWYAATPVSSAAPEIRADAEAPERESLPESKTEPAPIAPPNTAGGMPKSRLPDLIAATGQFLIRISEILR